jgi:hypothetical protein
VDAEQEKKGSSKGKETVGFVPLGLRRKVQLRPEATPKPESKFQIFLASTKRLNEQVKRNRRRFAEDFMFRLNTEEVRDLNKMRSQSATTSRRNVRFPYVFTWNQSSFVWSTLRR